MKLALNLLAILLSEVLLKQNHYDVLGVPKNFDAKQLKTQYRKLAKKYHPDNNPGKEKFANKKFIEIQNAYETLKDPEKRRLYDMGGEEAVNQ